MKKAPDTSSKGKADKTSSYYDLHTGAVEDLVSANPENTPRYSKQELEKYRSGRKKWHLPEWLKVILIKFWFYGAVCFFVFMGLGMYVVNQLDMLFVAAIVLGMVTDLLINHFLRFTEKLPGGNARWIMVTKRGATGFLMNLMYGFLLLFLVVTVYNVLNSGITAMFAGVGEPPILHVEPILFGIFTTAVDTLYVTIRNTLRQIVRDARKK